MRKIPVGETISAAYGFALAGFLTVLGTMWFPVLLLYAYEAALVHFFIPDLLTHFMHRQIDLTDLQSFRRIQWPLNFGALLFWAMWTVGLQERAQGRVSGPTFFYFSLGGSVWRLFGGFVLAYIAFLIIVVVTTIVAVVSAIFLAKAMAGVGALLAALIAIAAVCWVIYVAVRLFFFLPAVVVAEGSIGLIRSWELSAGNFWRIFAVMFVAVVPVMLAISIAAGIIVMPLMPWDMLAHIKPHMAPDEANEFAMKFVMRMFNAMAGVWPIVLLLSFIHQILLNGLANGAAGKAYVAVTEGGSM